MEFGSFMTWHFKNPGATPGCSFSIEDMSITFEAYVASKLQGSKCLKNCVFGFLGTELLLKNNFVKIWEAVLATLGKNSLPNPFFECLKAIRMQYYHNSKETISLFTVIDIDCGFLCQQKSAVLPSLSKNASKNTSNNPTQKSWRMFPFHFWARHIHSFVLLLWYF